jgi:hypothetical protein
MADPRKIFVLDEIEVLETQFQRLRDAYMQRYVPSANARGMTLEGAWRSPTIALADRTATFRVLWSVPDVTAWWGMRLGARRANAELDVGIDGDEEKSQWWNFVDSIAIGRRRNFMTDVA